MKGFLLFLPLFFTNKLIYTECATGFGSFQESWGTQSSISEGTSLRSEGTSLRSPRASNGESIMDLAFEPLKLRNVRGADLWRTLLFGAISSASAITWVVHNGYRWINKGKRRIITTQQGRLSGGVEDRAVDALANAFEAIVSVDRNGVAAADGALTGAATGLFQLLTGLFQLLTRAARALDRGLTQVINNLVAFKTLIIVTFKTLIAIVAAATFLEGIIAAIAALLALGIGLIIVGAAFRAKNGFGVLAGLGTLILAGLGIAAALVAAAALPAALVATALPAALVATQIGAIGVLIAGFLFATDRLTDRAGFLFATDQDRKKDPLHI